MATVIVNNAGTAGTEPWGLYSLTHGTAPRDDALARPYVRGASVRAYWKDFEPDEGRFDWTLFDETLARAQRHGKRAAFRVMNGTGTPEWVYAAGAQPYNPQDRGETRLPLPWGPVRYDPQRRHLSVPGAARLRYTTDGTYPVPIRPDWALSRSAGTIEGDTFLLDHHAIPPDARVLVVPIVLREDGKEALGDVYDISREGPSPIIPPLAAVEDLSQKE